MDRKIEALRYNLQTAQANYDLGCDGPAESALWYELEKAERQLNQYIYEKREEEKAYGNMPDMWQETGDTNARAY